MPAIDNIVTPQTSNVSLSNTEASLIGATGIPIPSAALAGPGRSGYIGELSFNVPTVSGLTAGTTTTVNVRNGTTSSGTLLQSITLGGATGLTTAGLQGAIPIPAIDSAGARVQNIFVGVILSASTATANGSAANPITATFKLFD